MRILFVTNVRRYHRSEALGTMYLSSVLRRAGHETRFVSDIERRVARHIREWQPGIVAYGSTSLEHRSIAELNLRLREHATFLSVFGGGHATFFPEVIEEDGIDVICVGEGEDAMLELANAVEAGQPYDAIPNLWVKKADGSIVRNAHRKLIEDLDTIPFPDRDSYYDVFNSPRDHGVARFIASRGCPFNCAFCFNNRYFEIYRGLGKRVRRRSPENLVEEMAQCLRDHPFQLAIFLDDVFPWDLEWLAEFRTLYVQRVGRPFSCYQRVEQISPELCRLLKEAGCVSMLLGIENGNETLRREMLNRQMSNDAIRKAYATVRQAGIIPTSSNIFGVPGETVETAMDTIRLNIECKPGLATTTYCQPFPGTQLTKKAIEMGVYDGDLNALHAIGVPSSWNLPDKQIIMRLRAIAPWVIEWPFLLPLVPLLRRLPLLALYDLMTKLLKGYCYKYRIFPTKLSPVQFVRGVLLYLGSRGPF